MNMTDYKDISQRLSTLEFLGYSKVITELLSAYDIVQTTIDRIASKINDGEPGPSMFIVEQQYIVLKMKTLKIRYHL